MFYPFPKHFSWGSAIWAQGTEGAWDQDGRAATVYEKYHQLQPERFYQQQGPDETLDWYHRYPLYHDYLSQLNHQSFRTSILWARLMPDGKNVDPQARDYYQTIFRDLKQRGMDVYVVLYWFDMPVLFEDRGGFGNREVIDDFVAYCHTCFELFDDLVDIWHIYNEPRVDADLKYLDNRCYPNIVDFRYHSQVIFNMVLAHARVVECYKQHHFKKKIGSVIDINHVYPRSQSAEDVQAAEIFALLNYRCFLDPLIHGRFAENYFTTLAEIDAAPQFTPDDLQIIANNTIDVLGINYYFPARVKAKEHVPEADEKKDRNAFYDFYDMPGRVMNTSRGWEIYPQALYDTLMMIKQDYRNVECYISENGMGVEKEWNFRGANGEIQDDYRIEFLQQHLRCVHRAVTEGVNLRGYHLWSFIDLWSPSNQFKNMYGLVEFNPQTKETRLKKSAHWYRQLIADNGFTLPDSEE